QDDVFLQLQQLLAPFGITKFYTDGWGAYERHLDAEQHQVGKENTQKIESKHINLRTRIKRLVRRTLCFSKTEHMHDLVIGRKTLRLPRCLRRGGMSDLGSGLDARCQDQLEGLQWRHGSPTHTPCRLRHLVPLGLVAQVPTRRLARGGPAAGTG